MDSSYFVDLVLAHLSRCLDQETAKGPFRSSSQAATCYYQSNHCEGRGNPVKCVAQGHKHICRLVLHTIRYPFAYLQLVMHYSAI